MCRTPAEGRSSAQGALVVGLAVRESRDALELRGMASDRCVLI